MITEVISAINESTPFFVVDNTKSFVPLRHGALYTGNELSNPAGLFSFDNGDNINILSVAICAPNGYLMENSTKIDNGNGGININLKEFGLTSSVNILKTFLPFYNYECAIGQFNNFDPTRRAGYTYTLKMVLLGLNSAAASGDTSTIHVSMRNIPDSENGKTYYSQLYCKIQHTLPMVV